MIEVILVKINTRPAITNLMILSSTQQSRRKVKVTASSMLMKTILKMILQTEMMKIHLRSPLPVPLFQRLYWQELDLHFLD